MPSDQAMKRAVGARLAWAVTLVLITALLSSCAKPVPTSRPQAKPAGQDAASILRSLHDQIVYVVTESTETSTDLVYTYRLFSIDPIERKPRLLLTSDNEMTTRYLPGRDKMLVHMAVSGNTRTGNDYIAGIDGAGPKLLVRGGVADIFPDGKRLLVGSDFSEGGQSYFLYSADLSGKVMKRLTFRPKGVKRKIGPDYMYEGDWGGDVSPDGTSIVYASSWYAQGGGPDDLFRIASDGSEWTRLTDGRKTHTDFSVAGFSHDGARVAAYEATASGTEQEESFLTLMDIDGRVMQRYPLGGRADPWGFEFGGWSPDDDQVALASGDAIALLHLKTGKSTTILSFDGGDSAITSVSWLE